MKQEILSRIQKNFPLVPKPFKQIADELKISEDTVLKILREQKKEKIIRQTSAIFDTKRLGYKSSLVAFEIAKDKIDEAVKIINSHPGISHNYERNHTFNIWFTLAIPSNSILGLEKTIKLLAKLTKADDFIMLPTLKLFKISVKLNTTGKDNKKERVKTQNFKDIKLTSFDYEVVKEAQKDLEMISEPFKKSVKRLNINYEDFFATLQKFKDAGVMRRFASILNHRKAGFNANAMVVWDIEEKDGEDIGKTVAKFSAVSHCYLRPKYPNWQYNLFSMIHGKTTEETNGIIDEIAKEIKFKSYKPLYSSREFKKVRIEYFSPKFEEWEKKYTF